MGAILCWDNKVYIKYKYQIFLIYNMKGTEGKKTNKNKTTKKSPCRSGHYLTTCKPLWPDA